MDLCGGVGWVGEAGNVVSETRRGAPTNDMSGYETVPAIEGGVARNHFEIRYRARRNVRSSYGSC